MLGLVYPLTSKLAVSICSLLHSVMRVLITLPAAMTIRVL